MLAVKAEIAGRIATPTGTMTEPVRITGTAYQPNASRPTLVIVTSKLVAANDELRALMDSANPPTDLIERAISQSVGNVFIPLVFEVPAGFYYKLEAIGTAGIDRTREYAR